MQSKVRTRLVLLDRLTKKMQDEKVSKWDGEKMGTWVFEPAPVRAVGKPIARLYLNREFISGVFVTKNPKEYSADLKEADRRRYLLLRTLGSDSMEVYERVPEGTGNRTAIASGSSRTVEPGSNGPQVPFG